VSRDIPLGTLQEMFALEADEHPIILLTIERTGSTTFRLSSDPTERITVTDAEVVYGTKSNGEDFLYFPFDLILTSDQEGAPPRMTIRVDNVTAEISWWLMESTIVPEVTVTIVSSGDVDTAIASFPDFEMRSFSAGIQVEGQLVMSALEHEPFPSGTISPAYFPGLF